MNYSNKIEQLKTLTDIALVEKVKNENCSDSFLEIERRHQKLYFNICSSYSKKVPHLKYDEIIQDSKVVLNRAIQSFKPSKKTKLSSWIGNFSRYHCLNTIRILSKHKASENFTNENIDILNDKNNRIQIDNEFKDDSDYVFSVLGGMEDPRISKIFKMRYLSDTETRKWKNIAKTLDITPQRTMALYKKGKQEILSKI